MKKKLILAFIPMVILGCHPNRVFEEHQDPSGNLEWNRNEVIKLDVEINDISIKYDVLLALRFANGYAYSFCNVELKEVSPTGKEQLIKHQFITRDEGGYTGDGAGDIYDLESILVENRLYEETGIYHYEISHTMSKDKIHMVMEVGMIIEKVPSETSQ